MGAGGVVALKLVVDLSRGVQRLLQIVRAAQRRRTVQLIHIEHRLGNINVAGVVVQLLADQLFTEHGSQLLRRHGLERTRIQQRGGLVLHICPDIIPCLRHLTFFQINFIIIYSNFINP